MRRLVSQRVVYTKSTRMSSLRHLPPHPNLGPRPPRAPLCQPNSLVMQNQDVSLPLSVSRHSKGG